MRKNGIFTTTVPTQALSISPVAGRDKMSIILIKSNNIPTSIKNWISGEGIKMHILLEEKVL